MLKSVLVGLILENIESLNYYKSVKGQETDEQIFQFVSSVITGLPWYYYLPVMVLANCVGLLSLITAGKALDRLPSEKRSSFLRRLRYVPFFNMLNKLVRSMAFLKLFDCLPGTQRPLNSSGFEIKYS